MTLGKMSKHKFHLFSKFKGFSDKVFTGWLLIKFSQIKICNFSGTCAFEAEQLFPQSPKGQVDKTEKDHKICNFLFKAVGAN